MARQLDYLLSEHFSDSVGFILPPAALRLVLGKSVGVQDLTKAIRRGEVSTKVLRSFVSRLASEFKAGEHLRGDLALAALTVAVESHRTKFADEFIKSLANLHVAELPVCTRIARECLKYRKTLPKDLIRINRYPHKTPVIRLSRPIRVRAINIAELNMRSGHVVRSVGKTIEVGCRFERTTRRRFRSGNAWKMKITRQQRELI